MKRPTVTLSRRGLLAAGVSAIPLAARADSQGNFFFNALGQIFGINSAQGATIYRSGQNGPSYPIIHNPLLGQFGVETDLIPFSSQFAIYDNVIKIESWNQSADPRFALFGAYDTTGYVVNELRIESTPNDPKNQTLRLLLGNPGSGNTYNWIWQRAIPTGVHVGLSIVLMAVETYPWFSPLLILYDLAIELIATLNSPGNPYSYTEGIQPGLRTNLGSLTPITDPVPAFNIPWLVSGNNVPVVYYQGFTSYPVLSSSVPEGFYWQPVTNGAIVPGTNITISKSEWNPNIAQVNTNQYPDALSLIRAQVTAYQTSQLKRLSDQATGLFVPPFIYGNTPFSPGITGPSTETQIAGLLGAPPFLLTGNVGGPVGASNLYMLQGAAPNYLANRSSYLGPDAQFTVPSPPPTFSFSYIGPGPVAPGAAADGYP